MHQRNTYTVESLIEIVPFRHEPGTPFHFSFPLFFLQTKPAIECGNLSILSSSTKGLQVNQGESSLPAFQ
jgi:hypothetical protein